MIEKKENKKHVESKTINVVLVIIVILFSGLVVLNISEIMELTGFAAVTSAKVNITISQDINYTLTTYNMSFGTGKVVSGTAHASLNSTVPATNVTTILANSNWTNTSLYAPSSLAFRNDGNCNINLSFTSSSNSQTFIGGSAGGNPKFEYNGSNAEGSSCAPGGTAWAEVVSTVIPYVLCTNFTAIDTKDTMYMDVRLTIPYDAVGDKLANLTFSANKV